MFVLGKNNKLLNKCLIIIITTLVISIGTLLYFKLDQPVFLKVYRDTYLPLYDTVSYGDMEFHLRYITNVNDTKMVNHIEFSENPALRTYASETGGSFFDPFNNPMRQMPRQQVGIYSIRTIYVQMSAHDIPVSNDDITLTKAIIHFNNGETMDVDIGTLVLYGDRYSNEHFKFKSGNSDSNNYRSTLMEVTEDAMTIEVDNPLLEEVKEYVDIRIDGVDYEKVITRAYKANDYMTIETIFRTPQDILLSFNDYEIHPKLHYRDSDGNSHIFRFHNLNYRKHNFEFKEVVEYLKARGEL